MIDALFERMRGAYSDNTIKGYRSDFLNYERWCQQRGYTPLPADTEVLVEYIESMCEVHKSATIRRKIHSLGSLLELLGLDDCTREPDVKMALKRANRTLGRAQKQATPLTRDILDKLKSLCDDSPMGVRNHVMLQLGYETMRRRSELCQFTFEDRDKLPGGRGILHLRRSKTDQEGTGKRIPISHHLEALLDQWASTLRQQGLNPSGPILRRVYANGQIGTAAIRGRAISDTLKHLQQQAGLTHIPPLSGHSFRVGAALDLLTRGVPFEVIMLRGGWRAESTALSYLRSWVDDEIDVYDD